MKRVISFVTVFVLCFMLVVPAFAVNGGFVPSITAKPAPQLVVGDTTVKVDGTQENTGNQGETVTPVVEVKDENKEVVYTAPVVDLIVTAVSQVQSENAAENVVISEEAVDALKEAYDQLNDADMKLSEESPELLEQMKEILVAQVTKNLEEQGADAEAISAATKIVENNIAAIADTAVVTALFDVTILSDELNEYLDVEGYTVDLTFQADVPEDHHVIVMVYKENKWQTIENVVVNGDGTITCTFAHFCPVAILTAPIVDDKTEETPTVPGQDAEGDFQWWWIVVAVVVIAAIIVVVSKKNKGAAEKTEVKQ